MRAIRFYAVGGLGIGVQLSVLWLLHGPAGLNVPWATAIAVEAVLLHNFFWHERFTWHDRPAAGLVERGERLMRFHLTNGAISLAGNLALTPLLTEWGVHYLAANGLAIVVCGLVNYLAGEHFVFREAGPWRRDEPR
jgi:putative flippase GtrA